MGGGGNKSVLISYMFQCPINILLTNPKYLTLYWIVICFKIPGKCRLKIVRGSYGIYIFGAQMALRQIQGHQHFEEGKLITDTIDVYSRTL